MQPGDRRRRQGPPRQGDRRARRRDGERHRRDRHPVPPAQREQGPGGALDARAGRQAPLPRRDARACSRRSPGSRCARARSRDLLVEDGAIAGVDTTMGVTLPRARRRSSRPARSCAARSTSATRAPPAAAPARRRRSGCRRRSRALGFPLARLKTGTPCRLDGRTHRLAGLEAQPGDDPPPMFRCAATRASAPPLPQRACYITYTTDAHARADPRQPASLAALRQGDRGHRPALLPVDRGQGRPLRRQGAPPDLPRARRRSTRARSTRTASRPRCRSTCSSRCCAPSPASSAPR